jgi:GntR family transcriptional regulator
MDDQIPVRQPSLADQVYEIIVNGIADGTFPSGSLLPSENQLAERFDVSRPTIRAAFARLVERGYVRRKRGIGTYVTEMTSITNPLYEMMDIAERIEATGRKPGFIQIASEVIQADEKIQEVLDLSPDQKVVYLEKIFTADEKPLILFKNYYPFWVFENHLAAEEVMEPGITEPFFKFFAEKCNRPVSYLASIIHPEIVKNYTLPEEFNFMAADTLFLVVKDVGYDVENIPLFLSIEHLFEDTSRFNVIRRVESI